MNRQLMDLWRDLVYAFRILAKSRGFTAVGILSLTLGIGVCSVFYSELNALVFRPLPAARAPEALVALESLSSYPYFERYRDQPALVSATAFVGPVPFSLTLDASTGARSARIFGHLVSPEYFTTLGVGPAMGRFFRPELEKEGTAPVAVISDRLWRAKFNSDRNVIGRALRLNGKSVMVIGVAPRHFLGVFPIAPADVFVPVTSGGSVAPELGGGALHRRDLAMFRVVGRLAPGVARTAAEAALDAVKRHLDDEGSAPESERKGREVRLLSASGTMPMPAKQKAMTYSFMAVLMGLILSLACTNLANLLLARASHRRKEVALRIALGANRFRLIRQLLTESVLLALAGGAGSVFFTYWMTNLISNMRMPTTVVEFDVRPDSNVLMVTLILSAIVGVAFGLMPALATTRADITPSLKEGGLSQLKGYRRFGFRNFLVAYQVASSLMLLLIVGYLVRGYRRTSHVDPGFETASLYLLELDPAHDGYTAEQSARLLDMLPDRLARLGSVSAVTLAEAAPFSDMTAPPNARFSAPQAKGDVHASVVRQRIGAGYFAALGVLLERGREFTRQDLRAASSANAEQPALVNQAGARELFAAEDPIGRQIRDVKSGTSYTIVGITRDLKAGFFSSKPVPTVFVPLVIDVSASATTDIFAALNKGNAGTAPGATIVARGPSGSDVIGALRSELASIDPNLTVFNTRTMPEQLGQMNTAIQIGSFFYAGIGIFGLILASLGLAGVTAYAVARRTKEIGIRMALGASPGQVLRVVMREGIALVAVGTVLGFAGAVLVSRALASMTAELARAFGASTGDPLLLVGAPLLLGTLAVIACYLPARKATRIDPLAALRQE